MKIPNLPARYFFILLFMLVALPSLARAADPGVDLTITKTGPAAATAGSDISYSIVVTANFLVGNPAVTNATLTDPLPSGWTVVSVSTTVGSCSGIGLSAISCGFGAVLPGAQITVNLKAHIPSLCQPASAINTATVAGDLNTANNSAMAATTVTQPNLGPGACYPSNSEVSSTKPGSILFFPFYTSSASSGNDMNTRIAMTNTNPTRGIAMHLFFVDGASCSVADSFVCLTPNQTVAFLMSDIDPGVSGYVIAVACDGPGNFGEGQNTGCPISFNFLIGHESVKLPVSSSGGIGNVALAPTSRTKVEAEIEAESVAAEFGSPVPGCNTDSSVAELRFNGQPNGYNRLPRVLASSSLQSRADGNSTYLIINRIGGNLTAGASTLGTLFGLLYDDSEQAYSFSLTGQCQLRGTLSGNFPRTVPRIDSIIPAGRSGWLKIWGGSDSAILGAQINNNVNTGAAVNAFDGGHTLHKLTFTNAAVLTVPIFPPSC